MQSPERGEGKSPQELLEINTLRDNEMFLEALSAAVTYDDVRDIIKDHTRVIKKNSEELDAEEEEFDHVVGHVFTDAEGKQAARFFYQEDLLSFVDAIEKNPSWVEQDIVAKVEHSSIADALNRIAGNQ